MANGHVSEESKTPQPKDDNEDDANKIKPGALSTPGIIWNAMLAVTQLTVVFCKQLSLEITRQDSQR